VKDLNAAEIVELEEILAEFCQNRRLDGLNCIVILQGRGWDKLAFPADLAKDAPMILAQACATARKYNASKAN